MADRCHYRCRCLYTRTVAPDNIPRVGSSTAGLTFTRLLTRRQEVVRIIVYTITGYYRKGMHVKKQTNALYRRTANVGVCCSLLGPRIYSGLGAWLGNIEIKY